MTSPTHPHVQAAIQELRRTFRGDIRDDRLYRALYSTDASIYQMVPDAVVLPRSVEDVKAAVRACAAHRVAITARGAGTGLAGGAVNRGVQLDCSRYLNRILAIDAARRVALVEPGVVLDHLNAAVRSHGLHFAADVATASRATLGGMISNNSCGAYSVHYGRTVEHVLALHVVLSDGSDVWWGDTNGLPIADATRGDLAIRCEAELGAVTREYAGEIAKRYPKVLRRNGGYALDRVRDVGGRINVESLICGSEGTLGIVVGAVVKLTPLPKHRGMVLAHFDDLLDALAATPTTLNHTPAAVELLDKLLLDGARASLGMSKKIGVIQGDPRGVLIVELFDEDGDRLGKRLSGLASDLQSKRMGYAWPIMTAEADRANVWSVRRAGLGLLMSKPGERQPYDFVDDTAVDPSRLRDYIARFMQVLREERVEESSYYAHASVGCLHVKPVLNLKRMDDVRRMHRVADRISSLALEFEGSNTGEHGDGLVRSEWMEKMFGPRLVEAFRKVKAAFDPLGILNPNKIVDPLPMTENLRWQPSEQPHETHVAPTGLTVLDFSGHGDMLGLADMCSGVGICRQKLVGTMCPSYAATGDEMHTTRARANALRIALTDQSLLKGLDDPALDEVMDLCLSCKACKTECPTGVDMAKLKAEWQHQRNQRRGTPLRSRLIAHLPRLAAVASEFAPITNAVLQSSFGRAIGDMVLGFDRRMPMPRFARQTFREWFSQRGSHQASSTQDRATVILFVDTWTNYFTPQVGIAAVRVLESLGRRVIVPESVCCGRPAISKGMLSVAKTLAEKNTGLLSHHADVPIVCIEPSCASALMDELPQLVRTQQARKIAARTVMIESYLADQAGQLNMRSTTPLLYHAHCHQKALVGSQDAMTLLRAVGNVEEINSGCCGMAGSFGHETEHYDVARAIGEERLFPAVRSRAESRIAVSGFSCRHQIEHHTDARPMHVVEYLAEMIDQSV